MTSRRTLRMETLPPSPTPWTTFTISRRRSSVRSGIWRRITLPSLDGVRPRSDSWIAFSIRPIEFLSKGVSVSRRASEAATFASCFSGVVGAVVVDDDPVEQVWARAARPDGRKLVAAGLDGLVHPLLGFVEENVAIASSAMA